MHKRTIIKLGFIAYEIISGKYKYRLVEDYIFNTGMRIKKAYYSEHFKLTTTGKLYIFKGYEWDGATGCPDTDTVIEASLVHDPLCIIYNKGFLPKSWIKRINDIFTGICRKNGMSKIVCKFYRVMLKFYWRLK